MKPFIWLSLMVLSTSCLKNQWEERIENGDTVTERSTPATTVAAGPKSTYTAATVDGKTIDGKALFKMNCAACHAASTRKLTGPGLQGVLGRIPAGDWKYNWVANSSALIKSGDAYAVKVAAENYNGLMTGFPALTHAEIDEILKYADGGE